MKSIIKFVIILIFFNLYSCSNKDKGDQYSKIKELNQEQEMITTYREAMENGKSGVTYDAFGK